MSHVLNWRLPGFGLILGLVVSSLLLFFGPFVAGPTFFFGLVVSVVGIAILFGAAPTNQLSSKLRAFSEWALIGAVWSLIPLIILIILTLH